MKQLRHLSRLRGVGALSQALTQRTASNAAIELGQRELEVFVHHAYLLIQTNKTPQASTPSFPSTPSTRYMSPTHVFAQSQPSKTTSHILTLAESYLLPVYDRPSFVFSHGKGLHVWDTEGRKYLDFSAGIAVNALGHGDEDYVKVGELASTSP
jgi:hypothetical protein